MSLLYVARPIDRIGQNDPFIVDVAQALGQHAVNAKFGMYLPDMAFRVTGIPPAPYVRMINNTALLFSDAVLAIWPHNAKSWGVPAEVERAVTLDKPVLVLTNGKPTWSMVDQKIELYPEVTNVDEAVRHSLQWLRQRVDENDTKKALKEAVRTR